MKILYAGTRGSMPTSAATHAEFGGDTTCLLVLGQAGEQILLDVGTGLRTAIEHIVPERPLHVLLTHFHLDHLMGLPAWNALYTPGRELRFAAPRCEGSNVAEAVGGLLDAPYWPVALDQMQADIYLTDLGPRSLDRHLPVGGLEVRWVDLPHPGGCTAYRIDEPATGASVVFATDAEWAGAAADQRRRFIDLAVGCDLLVADGQYDPEVMDRHRGWGHTSWADAADLAREAGCKRLAVTHHDPDHDDATLLAREQRLQAAMPTAELARQGRLVNLPGEDAS